jgi:hypothetical protein
VPSFTHQAANLNQVGPVTQVLIGPSPALVQVLTAQGLPIPQAVPATALVDTGASGTSIVPSIVQALGLQPVGTGLLSTPSTHQPQSAALYDVSLVFLADTRVQAPSVRAMEVQLGGQAIQCLIGRDLLSQGVLVYVGYAGMWTLSF